MERLAGPRLDLDMAGTLVANFLQSWLQAGTVQEPHAAKGSHDNPDSTRLSAGWSVAEDLPRLWQAQTTSAKDRKRMLRLLIKDVTVEKRRKERKALLHIRWQGGALEDLSVDLPLPMAERLRYCETILTQVRTLASTRTDQQIAAALNEQQLPSATGKAFTKGMIQWIRYHYEIPAPLFKRPEELTVKEMARRFSVSIGVVHYWIHRGHLAVRRLTEKAPYWITLTAEKETQLKDWIARSSHIKMESIPKGP